MPDSGGFVASKRSRVQPRGSRDNEIGHLPEGARFDAVLRQLARTRLK
jgi:hypothetical protein